MFYERFYLFLICSNIVSPLRLHTNSRLTGFVLVDNNFTYVEELVPSQIDIATNPSGNNGGERLQDAYYPNERDVMSPAKANVRFDPPVLYFKDKVVGNSYRETVFIFNTSQNKTLRMEKIAGGRHSQIQIASFGDELVSPGGNTTFDIIFVGKDLVPLSTHYYIYTSKGILKYDVVSWCQENPYRITPMSSITLPLNSSYSHSITLRNPFPEPLQITEALLHGGDYTSHTLPPSIDFENAANSWTIQPYETKEILRVHFLTYEAWNLTTFQSIKLSTGATLLIPVEVEVVPRTGLYVPGHKIDFESGGHLDPPAVRPLHLCSSAKKTVVIESVSCESRTDGCEVVDFRPTALPPWSCAVNPIAKVKFVWSTKMPGEITNGGLLIKNDLDQLFRVNYTARVHHGGLTYDPSLTRYVTSVSSFDSSLRPFTFTNEYKELVAVTNVYLSFEAAEYFHIRGFEPSVMKPQEKKVLFNLQTRKGVVLSELKLDSSILLETNISTIRLPLRVYDGLLTKLSKVAPSSLHLGLVSAKSHVQTYFGLANNNPETIFVKYVDCNDTSMRIEFIDVKPGNAKTFYYRPFTVDDDKGVQLAGGFNIPPYHYASFKLSTNTSDTEQEVYAEVRVESEYQKLSFPVYMNVAKGYLRVSPDPFEIDQCYPGAYCVQQLTVESHFMRRMSIVNISTIPHTPYGKLLLYPNMPATIASHSTTIVGNILWEPSIEATAAWPLGYLGLPNNRTGRDRWLGTIERPNITRDYDQILMESLYGRYREHYGSPIDLTFRMDTTEIRNFLFKGSVRLQWPQVVSTRIVVFPLVQIGTISYENVTVFNPTLRHYMTVQAILASDYQQELPETVGQMMAEFEVPGGAESKSNEFFLDVDVDSPYRVDTLNGTKRKFTKHKSSVVFVLPSGANATIRIGFMPSRELLTTTRLYLRNDLTVLESVAINGAGAYPQLTLEGLDNLAGNLIKFVIPYETLKLCEENSNRVLNITTKKMLRLRNTGKVSVHIYGFTINGLPCQGYGFKITNCHNTPFVLKPGMSKRIEIYFTPDFTSARIEGNLQVESDMKMGSSMLSYTLYAALDSDWLRKCKPHLQRPYWEPLVYYLMIGMFFFLLIGVAIMAVYEVSAQTNRLINGLDGVEENVQPFYDLKLIELFFVRSSVPHHHHHHHHHHHNRTSHNNKSELTTTMVQNSTSSPKQEVICRGDGTTANGNAVSERTSAAAAAASKVAYQAATISSQNHAYSYTNGEGHKSNGIATMGSGATTDSGKQSSTYSSSSYNDEKQNEKNTSSSSSSSSEVRSNGNERNASTIDSLEHESVEEKQPKKGKKFNFEDVCPKSNWFRRRAKKEEKLNNGKQFLKNGWPRCLKSDNVRKDGTKSADEKTCTMHVANEMTTTTTTQSKKDATTVGTGEDTYTAVFSNASSHNNNNSSSSSSSSVNTTTISNSNNAASNGKCATKDVPRKLDLNGTTTTTTVKNGSKKTTDCTVITDDGISNEKDTEYVSYSKSSAASTKQPQKKHKTTVAAATSSTTTTTTKIAETTTKEQSKENVAAYSYANRATADELSKMVATQNRKAEALSPKTGGWRADHAKAIDTEALKPITNLPKSKEPFETLSSLCNGTSNAKSKRKSNAKKRVKEEKFVNLARELSIVFATPETIDRKSTTTNSTSLQMTTTMTSSITTTLSNTTNTTSRKSSSGTASNDKPKRKATCDMRATLQQHQQQQQQQYLLQQQQQQQRNFVSRENNASVFRAGVENGFGGNSPTTVYRNRVVDNRFNTTTSSFLTCNELYSRVVAPPTSRSSSSSSSSESTASYESSRNVSSTLMDSQPSMNTCWDSWNSSEAFFRHNGMQNGGGYRVFDVSTSNDTRNETQTMRRLNPNAEIPNFIDNRFAATHNQFCNNSYISRREDQHEFISDDAEDTDLCNFTRTSLSDDDEYATPSVAAAVVASTLSKPTVKDIWGPPTSTLTWSPTDLTGSPSSNWTSDAVSAISLSRLLRFDERKEKDIEQYRPLSSLWSTDMKSIWSHPKQE